jgi:Domain of unknown function (DUF4185)
VTMHGVVKLLRTTALVAVALSSAGGSRAADVVPYSAVAAPEWTTLFDRRSGWTGADGVYSIPLSGNERPGSAAGTGRTLILFSDTFVGTVNADKSRSNTVMVNNTTALLTGDQPVASQLQFNVRTTAKGKAVSMVVPKNPADASERFWPSDGVVVGDKVYAFAMRIKDADTPPFAFATAGASLLWAPASDPVPFAGAYGQKESPLMVFAKPGGYGETFYGLAVMPMTAAAGAPNPDGYLYVYGSRSGQYQKSLVVSRVKPAQIANFGAYRFWDGSQWVADIQQAAVVTRAVSAEFSVHPTPDGRFMLVHMTDLLGTSVAVRYGSSPVGPWGKDIIVWDAPEVALSPNVYVYGAKAHPHLSTAGELLISYHANTFDFFENFSAGGADIYRPRFIKVPLP